MKLVVKMKLSQLYIDNPLFIFSFLTRNHQQQCLLQLKQDFLLRTLRLLLKVKDFDRQNINMEQECSLEKYLRFVTIKEEVLDGGKI